MKIKDLEKLIHENNGHCPECTQTIQIYRYSVSENMAKFLRAMADEVKRTGVNDVDLEKLPMHYSRRTQVTKMRLHGLIARVMSPEDSKKQVARHWLITHKGYDFLNHKPIPKTVVVFNNSVLGHDEGATTIDAVLRQPYDPNEPLYSPQPVTPAESRVYGGAARKPIKTTKHWAVYTGLEYSGLTKHQGYEIEIEQLQVGKPVKLKEPLTIQYKDIAAFSKDWKIAE